MFLCRSSIIRSAVHFVIVRRLVGWTNSLFDFLMLRMSENNFLWKLLDTFLNLTHSIMLISRFSKLTSCGIGGGDFLD